MDNGIIVQLIHWIQHLLTNYGELAVAFSVFLFGENAALAVFALSAQHYINPVTALIWAFIGSLLADTFWFLVAEHIIKRHYEKRVQKEALTETNRPFLRLIDKHFFWALVFIKFLPGLRLILTLYIVLKNKIPMATKILLNSIGTVLFMGALFPLGWYIGLKSAEGLSLERSISHTLITIVIAIIVINIILRLVTKYVEYLAIKKKIE